MISRQAGDPRRDGRLRPMGVAAKTMMPGSCDSASRIILTRFGPVEYRRIGSGPVVLVLHGGHIGGRAWRFHDGLACEGFTVLAVSRPGYDATPVRTGATAPAASDAIAALLDVLGIVTVDLVAASAAGPTGLWFAARHRGRLRKLILESAITSHWDPHRRRAAALLSGRVGAVVWRLVHLAMRALPDLSVSSVMIALGSKRRLVTGNAMSAADRRRIARMFLASGPSAGFEADLQHSAPPMDQVQAPVLIIHALRDTGVPFDHASDAVAELPCPMLCVVPHAGHLIWVGTEAIRVSACRAAFLRGDPAAGECPRTLDPRA